ncbi:hypothetical protein JCM33374_g4329 [Metschnikowia sp. JCM 33374]|nr:hypothetical protein JCM33374_g4329 [Metschnikowia sp. JCM 33374]
MFTTLMRSVSPWEFYQLLITRSHSREDPVIIQPGNREWVTVIECISAAGFALPPFIIMKGARLQKGWFNNIPPKWRLGDTANGWTNTEMALSWLQNIFIPSTKNTRGTYRLLLFDGHGSHLTPRFMELCEENWIKVQCMPAHASHRLQPLDLVCFSVLKRACRNVINEKILKVHSIDKFEFLDAYPKTRMKAFRVDNIDSAYRTAGLYLPGRYHVLSKLAPNICISTTEREQGAEDVTREDVQEGPKAPSKHETLKKLSSAANYWPPQVNTVARKPLKSIFKGYDEAAQTFLESAVVLSNEVTRGRVANMLQRKSPKENSF